MVKGILIGIGYMVVQIVWFVGTTSALIYYTKGIPSSYIGLGMIAFGCILILGLIIGNVIWEAYR